MSATFHARQYRRHAIETGGLFAGPIVLTTIHPAGVPPVRAVQ
jgi:hypothetical protein